MIYRLQRRFILICAVSVLLVVVLIFVLIAVFQISSMNRALDTLTDSLSAGNGRFPDSFGDRIPRPDAHKQEGGVQWITPETRFSTRYFTVWFDGSGELESMDTASIYSVTDAEAEEYAKRVVESGRERGWIANLRYKVFDTEEGMAVVFVDGTINQALMLQSLGISGVVLISAAVVILLLIVLFSKRVMKPVAQSYEKQKQFITDANHELKTPLTLILTNLDIAEAELGKNEWLDDICSEGQRMAELVNQLVALSRMDEEQPARKDTDMRLSEMVSEAVSEFSVLAEDREKTLVSEVEPGIVYTGDEEMLRRLVSILLDNAIQYCDAGGEIAVTLKRRRHIVLSVENTYRAVDELELDRLFDRFYRADKARTYTGGFGVGLSIAKSIAHRHRGEIFAYKKDREHIGFRVVLKP